MGRKQHIGPYQVFTNADMSQVQLISEISNCFGVDSIEYHVNYSGGQVTTNGDISVQKCLDLVVTASSTWYDLPINGVLTTANTDGATDELIILITEVTFPNIRMVYNQTNVASTGSLSAKLTASTKGA